MIPIPSVRSNIRSSPQIAGEPLPATYTKSDTESTLCANLFSLLLTIRYSSNLEHKLSERAGGPQRSESVGAWKRNNPSLCGRVPIRALVKSIRKYYPPFLSFFSCQIFSSQQKSSPGGAMVSSFGSNASGTLGVYEALVGLPG